MTRGSPEHGFPIDDVRSAAKTSPGLLSGSTIPPWASGIRDRQDPPPVRLRRESALLTGAAPVYVVLPSCIRNADLDIPAVVIPCDGLRWRHVPTLCSGPAREPRAPEAGAATTRTRGSSSLTLSMERRAGMIDPQRHHVRAAMLSSIRQPDGCAPEPGAHARRMLEIAPDGSGSRPCPSFMRRASVPSLPQPDSHRRGIDARMMS